MGCKECGKPKCNGECGCKSPKVLQINNPAEYITFHKVSIPAAMGDSTTNPPKIGAYRNALVYYEADHTSWMYSTDGIPTKLTNGLTDYNEAVNLPQINGETLIGDKSGAELGLQDKLIAGDNIQIAADGKTISATDTTYTAGNNIQISGQNVISATDTTYGPATDDEIGLVKPGDGLSVEADGTLNVDDPAPEDFFDGPATDSDCGTSITLDNMIGGQPASFELKGVTTQQIYSGKNRIGYHDTAQTSSSGFTWSCQDNIITINGSGSDGVYILNLDYNITDLAGEKPAISIIPVSGSWTAGSIVFRCLRSNDSTAFQQQCRYDGFYYNSNTINQTAIDNTTHASIFITQSCVFDNFSFYIMVTKESTWQTEFEPYVGGMPSPNPSYPQDVNVVTGIQTVTIGTDSYTINLGSMKLAELGAYRDKIYNDNGVWKIHEMVLKQVLDGTETWTLGGENNAYMWCVPSDPIVTPTDNKTLGTIMSNYWTAATLSDLYYARTIGIGIPGGQQRITISTMTDKNTTLAWLTAHTPIVYAALANSVDTPITDKALISDLNAIKLASGANSITITSSGLVGEICASGYVNNWNGNIEDINNKLDELSNSPYIEDIAPVEYDYINANSGASTHIVYSVIPSKYKPKIVMSDPDDPNVGKRASEFDFEHKPTIMTNLSAWNTVTHETFGPLIIDNDVKVRNNLAGSQWATSIIGFDDDGILTNISGGTSALDVGKKNACRNWACWYDSGTVNPNLDQSDVRHPRTFLAQDYDGNYLIGVCGGRAYNDTGMNGLDTNDFVLNVLGFNARIIFNLDGGGSSNFLYRGIRQNAMVDNEDRACPTWLVWSSPEAKKSDLYRNQSENNLSNVSIYKYANGRLFDYNYVNTNFKGAKTTINAQSRVFLSNSRMSIYNISFGLTENITTSDIILDNLPKTQGNYYIIGLDQSDYSTIALKFEIDSDRGCSVVKPMIALSAGKTYSFNVAVPCERQY